MSGADSSAALTAMQESEVQHAADQIRDITRRMASDAVEIGRILIGIKDSLPHGSYLAWVRASLGWTERTASNFVNVARNIGEKAKHVSHLPMATVYRLAAPSTPPSFLEGIFKRLEGGEQMQRNEIDAQLDQVRRAAKGPDRRGKVPGNDDNQRAPDTKVQIDQMVQTDRREAARSSAAALLLEKLDDDEIKQLIEYLKVSGGLSAADIV